MSSNAATSTIAVESPAEAEVSAAAIRAARWLEQFCLPNVTLQLKGEQNVEIEITTDAGALRLFVSACGFVHLTFKDARGCSEDVVEHDVIASHFPPLPR